MARVRSLMPVFGTVIGELTVLDEAPHRNKRWYMYCVCTCGNIVEVEGRNLVAGRTKSCHSCGWQEKFPAEYNSWANMHARCNNPLNPQYKDYGGRGIAVCKEWASFAKFLCDLGPMPFTGLTIERNDNELGYNPENCSWETRWQQNNNRRPRRVA